MLATPQRYHKQELFAGWGPVAQQRLQASRVLLCGCGALGSVMADQLTRAGVGHLRIVDRDFVDLTNLQRQVLFTEAHVAEPTPKAIAAAERLRQTNSQVTIEPIVADLNPDNIAELAAGCDLILDGLDNFETRFLINDFSLDSGIPWINGGCVGAQGQVLVVRPHVTACLRCIIDEPPEPGTAETCDTAGVLAPAVNIVASLQVLAAMKLLSGQPELVPEELISLDVWDLSLRRINLSQLRARQTCPACHGGERLWLRGNRESRSSILCGRHAVQITPARTAQLDLKAWGQTAAQWGEVKLTPFLAKLSLRDQPLTATVFPDGRAIIQGTEDPAVAKSVYARIIGY